jgi:arylsulfatase A-like enzyme
VAGYDGDIATVDDQLGQLWRYVRGKGWGDDTLVVVTADHGESMTEHGRFFCHGSLYDHDLHVPMVMWGPGRVPAGQRVDAPTSHVDVLPTLLDYAGLPVPQGLHGVSLKGATTARPAGGIPFALAAHGKGDKLRWAARDTGGTKVIVDRAGRLELAYDVTADPGETKDVSATKAARDLAARVKAWLATDSWVPPETRTQTLDDEDVARLRELGYVE